MANHAIGSVWRRWDLHVHTPASVVHGYGGSGEDAWDRFLTDLESLPPEFAVIGVNDYLFLDGYKRLRQEKAAGRIANIETLLPVVELRLTKFAGRGDRWQRVNFHVIFSEELEPELIEAQFLSQLAGKLSIYPEYAGVGAQWAATITPQSLTDLGRLIRDSIPPDRQADFNETDFELGFNNINFSEEELRGILEENSYLRGRYMTAVGKAEWDQMNWGDNSIAEKKNVINQADIVFTAAEDIPSFNRARQRLIDSAVNSCLFDCSDAHTYSNSNNKDRMGNCFTWVKGDPTFAGLVMALKSAESYEQRVFVGLRPAILESLDRKPGNYITQISVGPTGEPRPDAQWFADTEITANPELIAVIGNRGMGKSALLDVVALSGNSSRPTTDLTFLSEFQKAARGNLASSFLARLTWASGDTTDCLLSAGHRADAPQRVKHLPQQFIDLVCNRDDDKFEEEIQRVVFSHVPEDERLGMDSLKALIEYRSSAIAQQQEEIRASLLQLNVRIADLEAKTAEEAVSLLQTQYESRLSEARALVQNRPRVEGRPDTANPEVEERVEQLRAESAELLQLKNQHELDLVSKRQALESTRRIIALVDKLAGEYARIEQENLIDFSRAGLAFSDVIRPVFNRAMAFERESTLSSEVARLREALDPNLEASVAARLVVKSEALRSAEAELSGPLQIYEANRQRYREFRLALKGVLGSSDIPDSVRGLCSTITYLRDSAPIELEELEARRLGLAQELFELKRSLAALYRELYAPVQRFVDDRPAEDDGFRLGFAAALDNDGFVDRFLAHVSAARAGSFCGTDNATSRAAALVERVDFDDWESVSEFLTRTVAALHSDERPQFANVCRQPEEQLRAGVTAAQLYDFIYSMDYIGLRHRLTMGGRPLAQLSPGEKGALLLVFYLLVDQSECPLLIDQPEENLDNQSVYGILVPFIREARRRRQVILVTHNPNIAVVAGAEQVIHCEMDKAGGNLLTYTTGALENPDINGRVVDVLEGTRPAFDDREKKYRLSAPR